MKAALTLSIIASAAFFLAACATVQDGAAPPADPGAKATPSAAADERRAPTVTAIPGKPNLLLGNYDVAKLGYVAEEFFVSGTASSYAAVGKLGADGLWNVAPSDTADYTTRFVVLKPADSARFNGTVIVEWLNVSGGLDAPADWFMAHREIVRAGYAYVAVSAQRVGVEGGISLSRDMSLKKVSPTRYASLHHPGDAFAYDIFSQAGRLVRDTAHNGVLGGLSPQQVLAVGESQAAIFLTTYVNAIDPLASVYDGFLIHSRFGPAAPLDGSLLTAAHPEMPAAPKFRPDLRVPLVSVITETDLMGGPLAGYYLARQPDNEKLRTWEIPGAAHADSYTIQVGMIDTGDAPIEKLAAAYAPTKSLMGKQLARPINFAPQQHYVLQAALAQLNQWVRTGNAAPAALPMALNGASPPQLVLDKHGIARGGIRTPWVDVPVAGTSGAGEKEDRMLSLFGSGEMFDAATLKRLYPGGVKDYVKRFEKALDEAIRAGFILPADRAEILALAAATYPRQP